MGGKKILPDDPIISVNEYAYYNGSVKFGPMLGVILDSVGIMKRMFTGAVERWTEQGKPRYIDSVEKWENTDWNQLPATEILKVVRQLTEAAIDAYGALVSGVIPAAWMSEAWFTFTYKFVRKKGDPEAPVFLMGYENIPVKAEKTLYDLAHWSNAHTDIVKYFQVTSTAKIADHLMTDTIPDEVSSENWQAWKSQFMQYLRGYGHMIYNLDFGSPVPADDPCPVLETFKMFLNEEGVNPHQRQQHTTERREEAVRIVLTRLKGRRLKRFKKNLQRAQKFAPLREDGLADVGLSYPIIRKALRNLATRLVKAGVIEQPSDIYWLEEYELVLAAESLDNGEKPRLLGDVVPQRVAVWRAAKKAAPPVMLPQIKLFGVDLVALKTGAGKQNGDVIKGVAASSGTVTAPACVLQGPEEFHKMKVGDVLVASITTPAWTPLFARASAVVTDIGGPLSHGSIVAREYGIPAVLGTIVATARITDGQMITVDGSAGTVSLGTINEK
jgi:pyruvate,water dikinase